MATVSGINGTPWHVETLGRKENDKKRHRSKCAFYSSKEKFCSKYVQKCFGSAHCPYYTEQIPIKKSKKSKKHNKKHVFHTNAPKPVKEGNALVYKPAIPVSSISPVTESVEIVKPQTSIKSVEHKNSSHSSKARVEVPGTIKKMEEERTSRKASPSKSSSKTTKMCFSIHEKADSDLHPDYNSSISSPTAAIRPLSHPFFPGMYVIHKSFGKGLVSRVGQSEIRIQFFGAQGFMNFLIEECLANDLLSICDR